MTTTNSEQANNDDGISVTMAPSETNRSIASFLRMLQIIIPAAGGSAILVLLIVMTMCLSVACSKLRARTNVSSKVRRHNGGELGCQTDSGGTLLQENAAYSRGQLQKRNELVEEMQSNGMYGMQYQVSHEEITSESESYETVSVDSEQVATGSKKNSGAAMGNTKPLYEQILNNDDHNNNIIQKTAKPMVIKQAVANGLMSKNKNEPMTDNRESVAYDTLERKSQAYDTIDYRHFASMNMTSNVAYHGRSIRDGVGPAAQAVHQVKSRMEDDELRDSYMDEYSYEHVL